MHATKFSRTVLICKLKLPSRTARCTYASTTSQLENPIKTNPEKETHSTGRFNPLNIQLLSEGLHRQIFKHEHNEKQVLRVILLLNTIEQTRQNSTQKCSAALRLSL